MKKILFISILLLFNSCAEKTYIMTSSGKSKMVNKVVEKRINNLTKELGFMTKNWSLGNACNENTLIAFLEGDLDMQGHSLEIMNVDLKVNGLIKNSGKLKWVCPTSKIEIMHSISVN